MYLLSSLTELCRQLDAQLTLPCTLNKHNLELFRLNNQMALIFFHWSDGTLLPSVNMYALSMSIP